MSRSTRWALVDQLVGEQKYEAAFAELGALRDELGSDPRRELEQAEALIKQAKLRSALGGHAAAVQLLREAPAPAGVLARVVVDIFLGELLLDYLTNYSWEIGRRERLEGASPADLTKLTADEILAEAMRTTERVWRIRAELDREPVASLGELLLPGNYPPGLRDRLRELVSYQAVSLLSNTRHWRPEHSNDLYLLPLESLLGEAPAGEGSLALDDATRHPLVRAAAVLADLERWQRAEGRREAALEARLERVRRLAAAFTEPADRRPLEDHLRARLAREEDLPWWGVGQALLARLLRERGALVSARAAAAAGAQRYPGSIGAELSTAILAALAAPEVRLEAMQSDGLGRPTILVRHKNLPRLHFRAVPLDVEREVLGRHDYNLLPGHQHWKLAAGKRLPPVVGGRVTEWPVELPATPDYRLHKTFVVPPLPGPGLYVVLASAQPDFAEGDGNVVLGTTVVVSDYVLLTEDKPDASVEALLVRGATGDPVAGAEVTLVRLDYRKGHEVAARTKTNAGGEASFRKQSSGSRCAVMARHEGQWVLDPTPLYLYEMPEAERKTATLIYTDRPIYRPDQTVHFKVVAYRQRPGAEPPKPCPGQRLKVRLLDPNGELVAEQTVRTNDYASAAGHFVLPAGRPLGRWRIESSEGSSVSIRVEEYKRPTFEISWQDPTEPMRLGAEVVVAGEARYFFGLPVTTGDVRWRVERLPELPAWWWWDEPEQKAQRIAAGRGSLERDGAFLVRFQAGADPRKATAHGLTYRFRIAVEITDEGGETRTASRTFRIGFSSLEATIEPGARLLLAEQPTTLAIRRTTLQGAACPGSGRWQLCALVQPAVAGGPADVPDPDEPDEEPAERIRLPHDSYAGRWERGRYRPRTWMARWPDGAPVASGVVEHGSDGSATVPVPSLSAGVYRIRYETLDERGARCEAQHELLVVGRSTPVGLPAILETDRSVVEVGERLRLFAATGTYDQCLVLERHEAGTRVERHWLRPGDAELYEVPMEPRHRGSFHYVLSAVRDFQLMRLEVAVTVPWTDRTLRIELETFRDTLRPGQHEVWRVVLRGADGSLLAKRTAELLAYMFDRSLEAFAPHAPPDLLARYPSGARLRGVHSSLGAATGQAIFGDRLRVGLPAAGLTADRLAFYESWGVGGPGSTVRMRGAPMPPPACAPGGPPMPGGPPPALSAAAPPQAFAPSGAAPSAPAAEAELEAPALGGAGAPPEPVEIRSDFAETAFFLPELVTDREGAVTIEFDAPEAVTSWSLWLHAHTADLCGASLRREARTVKELLVRPYLPRFLREGDAAEIRVVVSNAGDRPLRGTVTLELCDPDVEPGAAASKQPANAQPAEPDLGRLFGITERERPFAVEPGQSTTVRYALCAPHRLGPVAVRAVARAEGVSDGEQRVLPVLPSRMHLAQSRFVTLRDRSERTLRFDDLARADDPSRQHERLVVTLDGQLFFGVVRALPFLVDCPYDCSEQLLNRYVSASILSAVFLRHPLLRAMAKNLPPRTTPLEPWTANDPNRRMALEETPWLAEARGEPSVWPVIDLLDPSRVMDHREVALERLRKVQTASGGFPWFPAGPPDPFVTLYLLEGFSRAAEYGVGLPTRLVERAWRYLTGHFRSDILPRVRKAEMPPESLVYLYFVLSAYRAQSLEAGAFTAAEREEIEAYCFAHWKLVSPMLKGQLALALHRAGRASDARLVLESVMDSAKSEPDRGTFWQPEERSWLWYRDTIESHAQILVTLQQIIADHPARDGLVLWLLLNKKLNQWKSTRATAAVIYALTQYFEREGTIGAPELARIEMGSARHEIHFEPDRFTGHQQIVVPGPSIDRAAHAAIRVSKETPGLLFASATWHFSTAELPARPEGDLLQVERRYLRCDDRGGEMVLVPLTPGAEVRVGDLVEVQLSLRAGHEAEYVHLRDPRPAGFEPEDRTSGYAWQLGIGYYREIRDSGTNLFFDRLPPGEVPIRYRIRAATAGLFRCQPATVQPMYAPEFSAYSAGSTIGIVG